MAPIPFPVTWFIPGLGVSIGAGFLLAPRLSRWFRTRAAVTWLLIVATGAIVAATLTPLQGTLERAVNADPTCDLQRLGLAPSQLLLSINDASLNILLFIPLGVAVGCLPRSRRSFAIGALAVALPFAIELTQLLAPALGRGCESSDVIDNLSGLAVGAAAAILGRGAVSALARPRPKPREAGQIQRASRIKDRGPADPASPARPEASDPATTGT